MANEIKPEIKAYSSMEGFIDSKHLKQTDSHVVLSRRGCGEFCVSTTHDNKTRAFKTEREARKHFRFLAEADQVA